MKYFGRMIATIALCAAWAYVLVNSELGCPATVAFVLVFGGIWNTN
jgi:hypothetical protein